MGTPGLLTAAVVLAIVAAGCTGDSNDPVTEERATAAEPSPSTSATQQPRAKLPRGGRKLFPRHRVVAYYGAAGTDQLGVLGETSPRKAAQRVRKIARSYRGFGRPVLPALELIATVAHESAGNDGTYSAPTPAKTIRRYLRAARSVKGLLVLDIQPGRRSFVKEVKRYRRFLREPDVGVALDPEWSMRRGEVPGDTIGSTSARVVNQVSRFLARIVHKHRLPQKLLIVHQFTDEMIRRRGAIKPRKGLAITFHVDGFGGRAAKVSKYRHLRAKRPFHNGFKLFYDEDIDMFGPKEVMRKLRPRPDLITYQ